MRFAPLLVLLLAVLTQAVPSLPASAGPESSSAPLRIGLDHTFRHSTLLFVSCERPFTLRDAFSSRVLAHAESNDIFELHVSSAGIMLTRADALKGTLVSDNGGAALNIMPGQGGSVRVARMDSQPLGTASIPWHAYRGFITVRREAESTLRVINTVSLEPYLYGVIPAEIGANVPMEAMKAQAVAARTYALKNRGKCAADGFDLDDTTHCEGYFGVDGETAPSNAAVDATRSQVLTYGGRLIDAIFSTDSGGVTACDLSGDCPYLQAVKDSDAADGLDYAANGRYHTWTQSFTAAQMAAALARDPRTQVKQFVSLTIDGLDASGRITTATVAGADGTLKTVTGPQIRQILGYDLLRSTHVLMTRTSDGGYRFDGKGWGHGMGMSQDGAVAMAGPPYRKTYREILTHYYVGAKLTEDDTALASAMPPASRPGF